MQHERRSPTPRPLDALAALFHNPLNDPVEGEIWRAAWESCVQLVLVMAVGDDDIGVAPVSPDVELGDDDTVRLEPGPPLTHALGVWRGLEGRLPMRVLDVRVAAVPPGEMERVRNEPAEGAAVTSPLDERSQLRTRLDKRMVELADATWIPASSDPVDLQQRIRERGVAPSTLARELDVTPGDVTDLVRGDRQPSAEQATIFAQILDVSVDQLMSANVDQNLIWALDRPQFRRRLAERGRAAGVDDEAAWRLHVATSELPVAARTTGNKDPRRRWMGLIQDYLGAR